MGSYGDGGGGGGAQQMGRQGSAGLGFAQTQATLDAQLVSPPGLTTSA